tara:strand:+ start:1932 stop:2063 length:132 start_codon:yes stop_codon:yes gene_type:complete
LVDEGVVADGVSDEKSRRLCRFFLWVIFISNPYVIASLSEAIQ